jgi:hypothetical protein
MPASELKVSNKDDKATSTKGKRSSSINTSKGCFSASCRPGGTRCYVSTCSQGIYFKARGFMYFLLIRIIL